MGRLTPKNAPPHEMVVDADEAFSELAELAGYADRLPELSVQLRRLFNQGTPGFDCEIDMTTAPMTGRVIVHYKLPKQVRAWLLALRAGKWKPNNINESTRGRRLRRPA